VEVGIRVTVEVVPEWGVEAELEEADGNLLTPHQLPAAAELNASEQPHPVESRSMTDEIAPTSIGAPVRPTVEGRKILWKGLLLHLLFNFFCVFIMILWKCKKIRLKVVSEVFLPLIGTLRLLPLFLLMKPSLLLFLLCHLLFCFCGFHSFFMFFYSIRFSAFHCFSPFSV
jgi:hypothetical protein